MRLVVALGGNALDAPDAASRSLRIRSTGRELADLIEEGHELVVVHGNGPQVGELLLDQEARAASPRRRDEQLPLDVLVSMTQGQLGSVVQRSLERELRGRGLPHGVAAIVTQVVVAGDDPAFSRPTKPIGPRHDHDPGDGRAYTRGPDGRWRRVVASPRPLEVVEASVLRAVLDAGHVPVCGGGGGVPVVREPHRLRPVEAVVDKDATSALIAEITAADGLLILTDIDGVKRGYGTSGETHVPTLPVDAIGDVLGDQGAGSMRPKLEAAAAAVRAGRRAWVGALGEALATLAGRAGTQLTPGGST